NAPANLFNGARKNVRAAVTLVVAVHRSHHRVAQPQSFDGFGHAKGLFFVRRSDWLARRHGAESTSACADVAQNHERRSAMFPALAHVRASRAFADGVQIERAHDALQVLVTLATKKLDAQPIRPRMRVGRRPQHRGYARDDMERRGHWARLK